MQPADLGMLEDFHTMGRIATSQLAELAKITSQDHVLDAGSGIGGTARFLASQYGCTVTAVDLTGEYCETSRWLNRLTGLDHRITVHQGDVTDLPLPDAACYRCRMAGSLTLIRRPMWRPVTSAARELKRMSAS